MIALIADSTSYISEALSGVIGALIGTFGGSWILYRFKQRHIHAVREIAINALSDIKRLAKRNNTYKNAEVIFNNINEAKKRAILTALYKVGIPITIPEDGVIDISNIHFDDVAIDKEFLNDIIRNIKLGHCDRYFYEDISSCISQDFRIKAIRKIGVKFVNEVFSKSRLKNGTIYFSENWPHNFTYGEMQAIAVFKSQICNPYYFRDGLPKQEEMDKLVKEINTGIWDTLLQWDYNAFDNLTQQRVLMQNFQKILNPQFPAPSPDTSAPGPNTDSESNSPSSQSSAS